MTPAPVLPRYGEGSLTDVLPSALAAMDVDGWDNVLDLPRTDAYVVLLVDGMGWNLLSTYAADAPYLSGLAAQASPITSGVPSTTATSLTSLGTGLPPGRHGVVGFTSRIPGTRRLLDALNWDAKVDPQEWQPHDTVFARASRAGVTTHVVSKRMLRKTGLSAASQRGAGFLAANAVGERVHLTATAATEARSLTYVYDADLDAAGHRWGSGSPAWRYQLGFLDQFARTLRTALPARVTLVVTADHGMVDVDPAVRVDVDVEAGLLDGVEVFGGEARLRHLYCAPGATDAVADRWRHRLGDDALVRTREEAADEGWFGAVEPRVSPRLGDVIVASLGDVAVVGSSRFPHEAKLVGLHGSLTPDEMLVPLLVDPGR